MLVVEMETARCNGQTAVHEHPSRGNLTQNHKCSHVSLLFLWSNMFKGSASTYPQAAGKDVHSAGYELQRLHLRNSCRGYLEGCHPVRHGLDLQVI